MSRIVYDPAATSIIVDLVLESRDDAYSAVIPTVLDTGASYTIVATDGLTRLGYDPASPMLERQRMVTGKGMGYFELRISNFLPRLRLCKSYLLYN
jgi:hypothetical protein